METFDRERLAENDGREGRRSLVAVKGKVYDVSASLKWKGGRHMMRHDAGRDLSVDIKAAPHGLEVFEDLEPVGVFEPGGDPNAPQPFWPFSWVYEKFPMVKRHAHPFAVHYPIAFFLGSVLFCLMYLITRNASFETSSFYLVALATLTAPFSVLSGIQSWWLYYGLKRTAGITVKLIGGPALILIGAIVSILRAANPQILIDGGIAAWIYAILLFATMPLVLTLGYIGGEMTFPD